MEQCTYIYLNILILKLQWLNLVPLPDNTFLKQAFEGEYPKLLRLYNDLWRRLQTIKGSMRRVPSSAGEMGRAGGGVSLEEGDDEAAAAALMFAAEEDYEWVMTQFFFFLFVSFLIIFFWTHGAVVAQWYCPIDFRSTVHAIGPHLGHDSYQNSSHKFRLSPAQYSLAVRNWDLKHHYIFISSKRKNIDDSGVHYMKHIAHTRGFWLNNMKQKILISFNNPGIKIT